LKAYKDGKASLLKAYEDGEAPLLKAYEENCQNIILKILKSGTPIGGDSHGQA